MSIFSPLLYNVQSTIISWVLRFIFCRKLEHTKTQQVTDILSKHNRRYIGHQQGVISDFCYPFLLTFPIYSRSLPFSPLHGGCWLLSYTILCYFKLDKTAFASAVILYLIHWSEPLLCWWSLLREYWFGYIGDEI